MGQAIGETLFDIVYLTTVITIGIIMIIKSKGIKEYLLFGIMAITLGCGDAFHLIPRALALCTTGLENFTVWLGIGKWITSITMTVFYILLYYIWRIRYNIKDKKLISITIYTCYYKNTFMFLSTKQMVKCNFTTFMGNI